MLHNQELLFQTFLGDSHAARGFPELQLLIAVNQLTIKGPINSLLEFLGIPQNFRHSPLTRFQNHHPSIIQVYQQYSQYSPAITQRYHQRCTPTSPPIPLRSGLHLPAFHLPQAPWLVLSCVCGVQCSFTLHCGLGGFVLYLGPVPSLCTLKQHPLK